MAFENVNVDELKRSLQKCLDTINYDNTSNIINSLDSNVIWESKAKGNLKSSLQTLKDTRYQELKKKLEEYIKIVDDISSYKGNSSAVQSLLQQKAITERNLRIEQNKSKPNQRLISDLRNHLNNINTQLDDYNNHMNSIKNSINNSI